MRQFIDEYLDRHQTVLTQLAACADDIEQLSQRCVAALSRGNKLLICGNGGSAADAQHLAAELVGRFVGDRRALAAIALTKRSLQRRGWPIHGAQTKQETHGSTMALGFRKATA